MHVSSIARIKPHLDLARRSFQAPRTRVSTPIENRQAIQLLDVDRQVQAELNTEGTYCFHSRPPPAYR